MKNIIYITSDNPKQIFKYQNKIKEEKTQDGKEYAGVVDDNDCVVVPTHHSLQTLDTNKKGEYDSSKKNDVYKIIIEDNGVASITKLT